MSDSLLQSINSFQSSRTRVKEKLISMRSSLDKLVIEIEKSEACYEKMLYEIKDYRRKLNKIHDKRVKELEQEVEVLSRKVEGYDNILLSSDNSGREIHKKLNDPDNWYIKNDNGDLIFVSDSDQLKVASTVSILDVLVRELANGPHGRCEGFERISFSILYPAIYSKLGQTSGEKFYLTKVPNEIDEIIKLGKEFRSQIDREVPGHLTFRSNWNKNCKRITDWWIDSMIPLIYSGAPDIDLSDVEPYSFEQMLSWSESREDRGLEFGEVNDVIETSNNLLFDVIPQNGLKELTSKIDSGYFKVDEDEAIIGFDDL